MIQIWSSPPVHGQWVPGVICLEARLVDYGWVPPVLQIVKDPEPDD